MPPQIKMTVDVSLCGSVPRSRLLSLTVPTPPFRCRDRSSSSSSSNNAKKPPKLERHRPSGPNSPRPLHSSTDASVAEQIIKTSHIGEKGSLPTTGTRKNPFPNSVSKIANLRENCIVKLPRMETKFGANICDSRSTEQQNSPRMSDDSKSTVEQIGCSKKSEKKEAVMTVGDEIILTKSVCSRDNIISQSGSSAENTMMYPSNSSNYVPPTATWQQSVAVMAHPQQNFVHGYHQHQRHISHHDSHKRYYGCEMTQPHAPLQKRTMSTSDPAATVEPPSWAVPAKGEARLQPVCETIHTHQPVDLTTRHFFRIGRSPSSDIPLLHETSSRRHALLFHHPCGACYITDCHSAHGTFVDGVRVLPYPHPPRKIRRGALVRFGGPGAPTFVLKSFSTEFRDVVRDLGGVADSVLLQVPNHNRNAGCESSSSEDGRRLQREPYYFRHPQQWVHYSRQLLSNREKEANSDAKDGGLLSCIRGDGGGVVCIAEGHDAPVAALVLLNTRLNALGFGGLNCSEKSKLAQTAQHRFSSLASSSFPTEASPIRQKRNRSEDDSISDPPAKKPKSILATAGMLSPERTILHRIRDPNVSSRSEVAKRRVKFSDEEPTACYPPAVTPDEMSSDGEENGEEGCGKGRSLPEVVLVVAPQE